MDIFILIFVDYGKKIYVEKLKILFSLLLGE